MRFVILTVISLLCATSARGDYAQFSSVIKASLVFRDDFDPARHYPHVLNVFLRLDNAHNSSVSWVANSATGVEAELLDAAGKPLPQPAQAASIQSNSYAYLLPYGSRLDWLISHGGISLMPDPTDKYALMIGGRGWLIPIEAAPSYSLRIRLRGLPWTRTGHRTDSEQLRVLVDVPATKIEVTE